MRNFATVNRSGLVTLGVMLLVLALIGSYFFLRDESEVQKKRNTPAAKALLIEEEGKSFTDLFGNAVTVNDSFGKIMVVMSWASWCPQCTKDLEALGTIAKSYDRDRVQVLAINRAEDRYSAERYLNTMPPLPSELQILLDSSDYYFGNSGGYAMPETIIFAPDGSEALHLHGELRIDEVRRHIDQLLND